MNNPPANQAWFSKHFNEDYLVIYSARSQEQADREVEFVVRYMDIQPKESVLDLCCGHGRHLAALERLGKKAIGVDLSSDLLSEARRHVKSDLVCADMRRLPFRGGDRGFSVLVNFFTSFGYFESDGDNLQAAREMARVLRPGGRFLMDLMNAEPTIESIVPLNERANGRFMIREERSFCETRRRIEKKIVLTDGQTNDTRHYFESVRVYNEPEIRALLADAGLEVREVLGDFRGGPRTAESDRMIVTGRRSAS